MAGTITLDVQTSKSPLPAALDMYYDLVHNFARPDANEEIKRYKTTVKAVSDDRDAWLDGFSYVMGRGNGGATGEDVHVAYALTSATDGATGRRGTAANTLHSRGRASCGGDRARRRRHAARTAAAAVGSSEACTR